MKVMIYFNIFSHMEKFSSKFLPRSHLMLHKTCIPLKKWLNSVQCSNNIKFIARIVLARPLSRHEKELSINPSDPQYEWGSKYLYL
jgi:hypothetical protein